MKYKPTHNRTAFQVQTIDEIEKFPEFAEFYSNENILENISYRGPISVVWIDKLKIYHIWRVGQNKILKKEIRQPPKKRYKWR